MDSSRIRMESRQAAIRLVRVLEMTCPVDMPAFFRLHNSLKHSGIAHALRASAKELMKLLKGADETDVDPSEGLGLPGRMSRRHLITLASASTLMEERIQFCEEMLAVYAPALLIPFMFRHGRGEVACSIMFPPGMSDDRSQRKREGGSREIQSGSPVSSVHSEMASESDLPSPKTAPLQTSVSARTYRSKSHSTAAAESSLRHVSLLLRS